MVSRVWIRVKIRVLGCVYPLCAYLPPLLVFLCAYCGVICRRFSTILFNKVAREGVRVVCCMPLQHPLALVDISAATSV